MSLQPILGVWMPGWIEIVVILFVGLLLFGRRLPDVGRSLGKTIVEFKKGIREVESDVDTASRRPDRTLPPNDTKPSPPADNADTN